MATMTKPAPARKTKKAAAVVTLALAIDRSRDLYGLWYLRAPLMQAIACQQGEQHARRAVTGLDPLFRQAWPEAPVSRRTVLG